MYFHFAVHAFAVLPFRFIHMRSLFWLTALVVSGFFLQAADLTSINGVWVIDNQNILYRDDVRDYYLVTLDNACPTLDIRSREFSFHPAWSWQLRANFSYEVRPNAGSPCDVSRIAQIDDDKAVALRDAAQWRVWR